MMSDPNPIPLKARLVEALRTVYDPEIPVNIYDLGLIYRLDADAQGVVEVDMTLTAPACPVAGTLPHEVGRVIDAVPGVTDATVRLVWDPPWTQDRMSEEALLQLGML
ncbi:MAG: SUF system Fe-S cluster assembly protein [Candidatus Thiodiazotropha sp.]